MYTKLFRLSVFAAVVTALTAVSCADKSSGVSYHTVRFDSMGGSEVASQTLPDGAIAVEPEAPEQDGYGFSDWYRETELTNPYDFSSPVKSNLTLYAKWEQTEYRVKFNPNGGTWPDGSTAVQQVTQLGSKFVLPTGRSPAKTGCIFAGWYKQQQADLAPTVDIPTGGITIDTNFDHAVLELFALYKQIPPDMVAVYFYKFEADGVLSEVLKDISIPEGTAIPPADIPASITRDHYTRIDSNWYTDLGVFDTTQILSESVLAAANTSGATDRLLLFAKWEGITYTITFDTNTTGTTDTAEPAEIDQLPLQYPTRITAANIPPIARAHYTFDGWYPSSAGTGAKLAVNDIIGENITYYAKWTAKTYTVTFHANGGTFGVDGANNPITTQTSDFTYPAAITAPAAPMHQVFAFAGWNSLPDGKGTALVPGTTPLSGEADYYAVWTVPEEGLDYAPESSTEPWLGASVTMTIPETGWYKIELWGAQGGPAGTGNPALYTQNTEIAGAVTSGPTAALKYMLQGVEYSVQGEPVNTPTGIMSGGCGAYTAGYIYLEVGDVLYINIGGARVDKGDGGGFNGGGSGYTNGRAAGDGAGGGATDVRFGSNEMNCRIMVAGGGGGSADGRLSANTVGSSATKPILWKGGYAGIFGPANDNPGAENGCGEDKGFGGGTDAGGQKATGFSGSGQAGRWGYGGNAAGANESYGAGGGGWFGGSAGGQLNSNGSGGGGSSYISGAEGFIACSQDSTDTPPPPQGVVTDTNGGFIPRYPNPSGLSDAEIATSWTEKVFVHPVARSGKQEMPNPGQGGDTEEGHAGPGAARIQYVPEAGLDPAIPPTDDGTPFIL